nr:hypothetical protein Iba_scaffold7170CG0020 [Ipomoea batatas]
MATTTAKGIFIASSTTIVDGGRVPVQAVDFQETAKVVTAAALAQLVAGMQGQAPPLPPQEVEVESP